MGCNIKVWFLRHDKFYDTSQNYSFSETSYLFLYRFNSRFWNVKYNIEHFSEHFQIETQIVSFAFTATANLEITTLWNGYIFAFWQFRENVKLTMKKKNFTILTAQISRFGYSNTHVRSLHVFKAFVLFLVHEFSVY